jgi:hypothetical protein
MTFDEAVQINQKHLRREWVARKDELLEAVAKMRSLLDTVERQVNQPIPDLGLYEMYMGFGGDLKMRGDELVRIYGGLESVKFRAKFVEDLRKAVS